MKNTFKRIISVMLALFMLSGCISAFAAGETIDWYLNGYGEEEVLWRTFTLNGNITEGENKLGKDVDDIVNVDISAYLFTAETEGWYLFTLSDLTNFYNNGIFFSESYADGKAYSLKYEEYFRLNDDNTQFIFKLPAGESIMLLQYLEELTLTYEFLGEEVTDIVFDEGKLTAVIDVDIRSDSDSTVIRDLDAEVVFNTGKKYEIKDKGFDTDSKIVKGENNVTLELFGFEKEVTVTAVDVRDFVAELEPVNLEDDLVAKEYYTGYISADDIGEAKLIITYADGKSETIDFEGGLTSISSPNGRNYYVGVVFDPDTLTAQLCLENKVYETYDLEVVPADRNENLAMLRTENSSWLSQAKEDLDWRLDRLETADTFAEKISLVFWIPGIYTNAFYQIFCNIVEFIEFYI